MGRRATAAHTYNAATLLTKEGRDREQRRRMPAYSTRAVVPDGGACLPAYLPAHGGGYGVAVAHAHLPARRRN